MATAVEKKSTSKSSSRANEIVAIILLAITILVFLCLVSYSSGDWSFNSRGSQKTQNWVGILGAVISDLLFQSVGLTAYILPAMLGFIAWRVFKSLNLHIPIGRIIGFSLLILSLSGLFQIGLSSPINAGGLVGATLSAGLLALIGKIGSVILLLALFLTSVLLITDLTYLMMLGGFSLAFDNFKIRMDEWTSSFRQWRETQKAEAQNRLEKRREILHPKEPEPKDVKKPTISLGDKLENPLIPKKEEKKEKVVESKELPQIEEVLPAKKEDFLPKITIGEDVSPVDVTDDLPQILESVPDKPKENNFLIDEDEFIEIPISPIQQTGDLEKIELLDLEEEVPPKKKKEPQNFENYLLPTSEFLTQSPPRIEQKDEELLAIAQELVEKTGEFNVTGRVMHICQGPVVTTYEFKPDAGVKYSRITGLGDDLCLALKAESIRIDRIPGKAYVGIEVPNHNREIIYLREVIESKKFQQSESLLSVALGKAIDGLNYVADLTKMPHLLMAGQTGAGKSVGVNSIIVSILYKAKPDEVKLIMVDPKQVELGIYADIPHLATPIITDPKRASVALKWAVGQMERRYKDLAGWGVRNIDGYNAEVKRRNEIGHLDDNGEAWKKLPYIVIIIDELADLMMVAGKEVEESITRLAQMARAVGIHLVLATQRPSVDVITGLIKANFPSRISFRVSSKVDSRTIIDANGAESLLGRGDMLFLPPGTSNLVRVHGAFVDEKEIAKIVEHIKAQGNPEYDTTITKTEDELDDSGDLPGKKDPLFMDALRSVVSAKKASTSLLQRHLRIGYGRAAAILDAMVREGYIGEMDGSSRARPILEKAYEFLQNDENF
ncbi:MAG TPA: DNA translocase FtsK 4TM domain-containing protein [Pyrinomonadaceae bacterium]|nr:DNA translocase FtsK 4TM domain-containing protein [Pyrinomonadaceae bacterium]